ncbi:ABC transporter permease [Nocardioides daeguensis]|uniref:Autoinducer 2 import system permease protein LsrD n=1 Tax=Nocardioides daeguensis TaxID=908359 RepID=A0ABP6V0V6_9ACTN|nr:ABC transporter permease [Nocardioides daeguensis]MBV6727205.1 ABC transporter permease [Nocardioides daeguensis]MCR1771219.1 ABC transporter permease [Nocardioides daeguensis]
MTLVTEPEQAVPTAAGRPRVVRLSAVREYGIVVAFLAVFVFLSIRSEVFLTSGNLLNVLEQSAAVGIIACAGTLLLISGGFDLSVGATFALSGAVAAKMAEPLGAPLALLVGIAAGLAVGLLNGVLATVGRINPLVATLSSSIVVAGVALIVTEGFLISVDTPGFDRLGQGELFGISYATYLWGAFAVLCGAALNLTTYGRRVFAAGGNPEAARLSGIRVDLVRASTYALSGLAAGVAGVLVASRVSTGQADAGTGMEMQVIAAIVVGGTSIWGGQGAVWRTVLGVLLLALIDNGFNLLQVDPIYQQILQGAIILAAVALDAWSRQRR